MASDHVTLNVGGRLFYTTRGTLEFSKAGFFEALLWRWNAASIVPNSQNKQSDQEESCERPAKRLRKDTTGSSVPDITSCNSGRDTVAATENLPSTPIFIDRDPDAFEDVLYFMRTHQIKPATSIDACKVKQLQIEAEYLGYESLSQACQSRLNQLAQLHHPVPTVAYSDTAILGSRGGVNRARREIKVPAGHVLYVDFASIWGLETLNESRSRVNLGFYRRCSERLPDGQRTVRPITIICSGVRTMENPFARRIGICISPKDKNDKIGLVCAPFVQGILWQVHYWIGPPNKIPQLSGGSITVPERLDAMSLLLKEEEQEPADAPLPEIEDNQLEALTSSDMQPLEEL